MKKLKSRNGFTLIEMLACVVVLLLIGGICSAGMSLATRSYNESIYESDSQMLEDTLNLYLCDILRHATSVQTEGDEAVAEKNVISFTNVAYQIYDGHIEVSERTEGSGGTFLVYESSNGQGAMIVGENVYAGTLYISDFVLKYNPEKNYFTGYYTIQSEVVEGLEKKCEFTCRTIAEY
ncbi:MAG: type II secretion system protein [Agathobacter sp.]|nr:type II secretion system protein [Agathobacter sp.]